MDNGINFPDVGQKLIAQSLALARTFDHRQYPQIQRERGQVAEVEY